MICALVTLVCGEDTLGAVRALLTEADCLAVADSAELVDGAHAHVDPHDPVSSLARATVGDLRAWASRHADLPPDTAVMFAREIAVDVPSARAEMSLCGEHIGVSPANVFVTVNPACASC